MTFAFACVLCFAGGAMCRDERFGWVGVIAVYIGGVLIGASL